jgi:hypothetical protein
MLTIPVPLPHECGVPGGLDAALSHQFIPQFMLATHPQTSKVASFPGQSA